MTTTTYRNITAIAQLSGQGLAAGETYRIIKAVIQDLGEIGVRSEGLIAAPYGVTLRVKNIHLVFTF